MKQQFSHYVGNGSLNGPTSRPSVILTYSPSFPGTHPFTYTRFRFGSILYTYIPSVFHDYQQILHGAVLISHSSGHFLPLERLPRVLRVILFSPLLPPLSVQSIPENDAKRSRRATRRGLWIPSVALRPGIPFPIAEKKERCSHLRDALDVHSLPRNEVLAGELRA